jgi:hypothetical protein
MKRYFQQTNTTIIKHTPRRNIIMGIGEKVAKSTGKFTGRTVQLLKAAPKSTASKTKAIKEAFVDGVESAKPKTARPRINPDDLNK